MIKGITVTLYKDEPIGTDPFGMPVAESFVPALSTDADEILASDAGEIVRGDITAEFAVNVDNVLVAPVSAEDIVNDTALYGKRTVYQLGIPKGDTHDWKEKRVDIFGETFRTVGEVVKGIDSMIPLGWNGKIKVVRYE